MNHDRYRDSIQELIDGTLGPIRRTELELHLEQCEACRQLAADLRRIRDAAASLDHPAPPDRVWLQIAGRLRQEGRVALAPPVALRSHRFVPLAIAASLLLIVGASLYFLYPRGGQPRQVPEVAGNATATDAVQDVEAEFRLAEQHYQNAIARLEKLATADSGAIDPQTAALLRKNLQVIDQAIAESRAAPGSDPRILFGLLKRKVLVLQDTIALMNQMRQGNAAGAAQIVDSVNKS